MSVLEYTLAILLLFSTVGICAWLKKIDERAYASHSKLYKIEMRLEQMKESCLLK